MTDKVALYGLGNMGYPLAQRIARRLELYAFDLDEACLARARKDFSATPVTSPGDIADCRFIVLCLPHPSASLAVIEAILPHLRKDAIVIETSTVNPSDMQGYADLLKGHGAQVIDASILAGVSQMAAGTAILLLGGTVEAIESAGSVLDAITEKQMHFGTLGTGAAAKVINNAVAHAIMVVIAEAGAMATATGVDTDRLVRLLSDAQMGLHRPLTHRYAERIVKDDYEGGMPLAAARKDSELALALAHETGVPLFAIQASHSVYEMGEATGYGRDDYAAIAKLWAGWGKPVSQSRKSPCAG